MPTIIVFTNWSSSKDLYESWKKQSEDGAGKWGNIRLVPEEPADIHIVINGRTDMTPLEMIQRYPNCKYFMMEPYLPWIYGPWLTPALYFSRDNCLTHDICTNVGEWHVSYTYQQLTSNPALFNGKYDRISTIQSCKNFDAGHKKRLEFIEHMSPRMENLYCFGSFHTASMKHYEGMLPPNQKENGLARFKYHFAAENNALDNYFTEKIIDGILCECLVFYWGCPNLETHLPADSFIRLSLCDYEKDLEIIQRAISEDWWEKHLPAIREAKRIILNKLQFFPLIDSLTK
jgi:hypothetical protein